MQRPPRILVTRSPQQASALAERLRELGAEPVLIPSMVLVEPDSFSPLDAAIAELSCGASGDKQAFDWLIFTSANAVRVFAERATSAHMRGSGIRIAVIGAATARAVVDAGLSVDVLPELAVAESLAEALLDHVRQSDGSATRFLLVRAEEAREYLPDALRAAGAEVTIVAAYRNVVPQASVKALHDLFADAAAVPDAITFTSASAVRNLFALLEAAQVSIPAGVVLASIGPITSNALRELGYEPDCEAQAASVTDLAESVVSFVSR